MYVLEYCYTVIGWPADNQRVAPQAARARIRKSPSPRALARSFTIMRARPLQFLEGGVKVVHAALPVAVYHRGPRQVA